MIYKKNFGIGGNNQNTPFSALFNVLMVIGTLIILYFILMGFVKLLYLVAPILLIATLIINSRVVADYAIDVFETFRTNILLGVLKVGFSILCYPFIIGWLFAKALVFKKVDKIKRDFETQIHAANPHMRNNNDTQFAEFEELSSETHNQSPKDDKPILIVKPKPQSPQQDDYDTFFK